MKTGRIFNFKIIFLVFLIGLCMGLSTAQAASYYLDQSEVLSDDVNYLMVTISQGDWNNNTSDYDIDFTVSVLEQNFPGDVTNLGIKAFAFNFNNSLSADDLIDFNPTNWSVKKTNDPNISEFGKFEFELAPDTGGNPPQELSFSIAVKDDSVGNYAVSFGDTDGEFFAAHVAGFGSGEDSGWFAGSTAVPVPSAAYLLGSGLIFMVGLRRRKKK